MFKISNKAREDLKKVLSRDIGPECVKQMTDEDLDCLGSLFLTILAENLKMKNNNI